MKKIYTSPSAAQCNLLKSLLEAHGIPCVVRNEIPSGAALSVTQGWPEVWVLDDRQLDQARANEIGED
jgi:hypothetical protein